jgi:flagellar biosynthesis/type III secretory pathway chaperone
MDTRPPTQTLFHRILSQETEQAKSLLELLKQEFELLKSAPGKPLETLQAEKREQLKQVEQAVSAHHQFLKQQGLTNDRQGTEQYVETCSDNPALSSAWEEYLEILQACQKQNEINGGAVALNQRQVNQALNLLLGLNEDKTYGRSGESRPGRPSKSLGKA